jgi:hypothetical protein
MCVSSVEGSVSSVEGSVSSVEGSVSISKGKSQCDRTLRTAPDSVGRSR